MSTIEIDGDVIYKDGEITPEKPKKKPRGRRKKATPASGLLNAIKFIKPCQKKTGTIEQRHCFIQGNWIAATNGILTIGTKIHENLSACPQTLQLEEALKQVGEDLSITQLSELGISVVSGDLKVLVPCIPANQLVIPAPDQKIAVIDDRIKAAMSVLHPLVTEGAAIAAYASVLLQSGSAAATNGKAIVEYWHGLDLPPNTLIPKAAAKAIATTKKTLNGFGCSGSSATFWFEDDSFIKTQLFAEDYVNYQAHFRDDLNPWPIPDEFFKAIKTIAKFTKSGIVYFEENKLASDEMEAEASTYEMEGLPEGLSFNTKYLLMVQSVFEKVHFDKSETGVPRAYFFGDNVRGLVLGVEEG